MLSKMSTMGLKMTMTCCTSSPSQLQDHDVEAEVDHVQGHNWDEDG